MYKPESVLENETRKIHIDFEIQTDHLIPARRPDLMMIPPNKKNLQIDCKVKIKENEKRDKYLYLARELKKVMDHQADGIINCNWCAQRDWRRWKSEDDPIPSTLALLRSGIILRRVLET